MYCILSSIVRTFSIENDAEILPAHYTWKVAFTNLICKQSIQVKLQNEDAHAHCTCIHTILDKIRRSESIITSGPGLILQTFFGVIHAYIAVNR